MSSKQTKINFGSNRNKPKQDLFRVCFGLFRETKNLIFRFVSVFRTYIETTETNTCFVTNRNKPKQTEKTLNFLKNTQIYSLLNCLGGSSVCFSSIEPSKLGIEAKQPKQTVLKQTEKTEKNEKTKKTKKNGKTLTFL